MDTYSFANLDFQEKAIIMDYLHNLQLTYLQLIGYKPVGLNENVQLPVTNEIREFRKNFHWQAKVLNEIYHLSIWIDGETLENKYYGDLESEVPTITT